MSDRPGPLADRPSTGHAAALRWARQVKSSALWEQLEASGLEPILLKGVAFEALLYDRDEFRFARDTDLLVAPGRVPAAEARLRELGFEPHFLASDEPTSVGVHAGAWRRERDETWVDLHHTLAGVGAPPEDCWRELRATATSIEVAGVPVRTLGPAASALLVALHTAHHGPTVKETSPRGLEDLERALDRLDGPTWEAAAALAARLGAVEPFAVGLRLSERGAALADRLGVAARASVARRLGWDDAPYGARALAELGALRGRRRRARLVARILVPTPRSMRLGTPLARRGRAGLAAAYALRPLRLIARLPASIRAWRAARRRSRGRS